MTSNDVVLEDMVLVSIHLEDPKKSLGLDTKVLSLGLSFDKLAMRQVLSFSRPPAFLIDHTIFLTIPIKPIYFLLASSSTIIVI